MKRPLEETALEQLRAENERLKQKLKLYMLERNFLHKRRESDESEKQLAQERFRQKLTQLENEKRFFVLEYERLRRVVGERTPKALTDSISHLHHTQKRDDVCNLRNAPDQDQEICDDKGEDTLSTMIQQTAKWSKNFEYQPPTVQSTRIKVEPRAVIEEKFVNTTFERVRKWNSLHSEQDWMLSPRDSGFKQELVVIALKALGGTGTLDDVDKWIRKRYSHLYGNILNRTSISRALSRQADSNVLHCDRRTKTRRWNIYYVPGMVQVGLSKLNGEISTQDKGVSDEFQSVKVSNVPSQKNSH